MARPKWDTLSALAHEIREGNLAAISHALTKIESTRSDHRKDAETLLEHLLPYTGGAFRVGITGTPGVGKSTLIEAFGCHLLEQGHRVAVLAVDPSSEKSGGSILGDKTRMERLGQSDDAFIRPSPAGKTLGGVAHATRESILVLEAAGFNYILVETVGVGQSEAVVRQMVDVFVLLVQPAAGDELQGIKRGILELADIVVVTKNDGNLKHSAQQTARQYANARMLLQPHVAGWEVPTLAVSAAENQGLDTLQATLKALRTHLQKNNRWNSQRMEQQTIWFEELVRDGLQRWFDRVAHAALTRLQEKVANGSITPNQAAREILQLVLPSQP